MLPWGHAAVGYLLYVAFIRSRGETRPAGPAVIALAIGTQFADLVDKPLGWYLGVLPSGRSLGHSIFVAVVVIAAVHWVARRYEREALSVAFAIGHLSHLGADALYPVIAGNWSDLSFLLWPVVSQPAVEEEFTVIEVLVASSQTTTGVVEAMLFVGATALWVSHSAPGIATLYRGIRSVGRRVGNSGGRGE